MADLLHAWNTLKHITARLISKHLQRKHKVSELYSTYHLGLDSPRIQVNTLYTSTENLAAISAKSLETLAALSKLLKYHPPLPPKKQC